MHNEMPPDAIAAFGIATVAACALFGTLGAIVRGWTLQRTVVLPLEQEIEALRRAAEDSTSGGTEIVDGLLESIRRVEGERDGLSRRLEESVQAQARTLAEHRHTAELLGGASMALAFLRSELEVYRRGRPRTKPLAVPAARG